MPQTHRRPVPQRLISALTRTAAQPSHLTMRWHHVLASHISLSVVKRLLALRQSCPATCYEETGAAGTAGIRKTAHRPADDRVGR